MLTAAFQDFIALTWAGKSEERIRPVVCRALSSDNTRCMTVPRARGTLAAWTPPDSSAAQPSAVAPLGPVTAKRALGRGPRLI